jgi:hypothetical protein
MGLLGLAAALGPALFGSNELRAALGERGFLGEDLGLRSDDPDLAKRLIALCLNEALSRAGRGQAATAIDACDQGLEEARALEAAGNSAQRQPRERLFRLTLRAYSDAGMTRLLPEVTGANLDPAIPGSAADSADMHRAAMDALRDAMADTSAIPALVAEMARLATAHARFFAGTAASARMRAELARAHGQPDLARKILDEHIARRPEDPEGRLVRAEWLLRDQNTAAALEDFAQAARLTANRVPNTPALVAPRLAAIAETMLRLRLPEAADQSETMADAREQLTRGFDRLHTWLIQEWPRQTLRDLPPDRLRAWEDALGPVLNTVWEEAQAHRDSLLEQWLSARDDARRDALRAEATTAALGMIVDTIGATPAAPARWSDLVELLAEARLVAETEFQDAADSEQREDLVREALANALRRGTLELQSDALANTSRRAAAILGAVWDEALDETERRYVAGALRFRDDPPVAHYTALELGCGVEWSLVERVLRPLRAAVARQEVRLAEPRTENQKRLCAKLARDEGVLMLGNLLRTLQDVLERMAEKAGEAGDVLDAVTGWLRIQPGAAGLAPDAALVGQRAKALWALNEARRMAAHMGAGSVSAEMVGGVWHDSVEDPDLAFFRWFPAAFSKRLMRSGSPIISGLG